MNIPLFCGGLGSGNYRTAAFTLPELMVAMVLFLLVVGGVLGANLFGLRMFQITENKLTATGAARRAIGTMTDEIRNCKSTWVGNVSNGVFVAHLNGEAQTGNAVMICPTTNAANFVIYFVNPSDQSFRRTTSPPVTTTVLARSVTNLVSFRAQDCLGNVMTNNQNNRVIHFNLQFQQAARFGVVADSYTLATSVTRRALD
jgi:prepilin-type N-terminal cleavage/methylation domain-containing protein